MRCLPFATALYRDLQQQGIDAATSGSGGSAINAHCSGSAIPRPSKITCVWLISVGVLRREVDGQGLTSRFRLTPLGRQLLDADPDLLNNGAGPIDQLRNALRRAWPR